MDTPNEKTLRRFQVMDKRGNLLKTVDIVRQDRDSNQFVVKCDDDAAYAPTLGRALFAAELQHFYRARKRGQIVEQVLL